MMFCSFAPFFGKTIILMRKPCRSCSPLGQPWAPLFARPPLLRLPLLRLYKKLIRVIIKLMRVSLIKHKSHCDAHITSLTGNFRFLNLYITHFGQKGLKWVFYCILQTGSFIALQIKNILKIL